MVTMYPETEPVYSQPEASTDKYLEMLLDSLLSDNGIEVEEN